MAEPVGEVRALVVGIDRYLSSDKPGSIRYPNLFGAVSDARRVQRYLKGALGLDDGQIDLLISSHGMQRGERSATASELVASLLRLESTCRPGDQALVFYSGHGGRAPTRLPEIKGGRGLDEVLAPMDIADPATPYVHDVEIAAWLARMVAREVFVTLILDCCHSGGAPRDRKRFRGIDAVDRTSRPVSGLVQNPEELIQVWQPLENRAVRSLRPVATPARRPRGWVSIAACRPHERALEDSIAGGESSGLLTHLLLEALARAEPGLTYRRLHSTICTRLHSFYRGQTPMIDGEADRLVFGRRELPLPVGVEILSVEGFDGSSLVMGAGRMHGVQRGAQLAIVNTASGGSDGKPQTVVEILESLAVESRARIAGTMAAARRPRAGERAVLVDPGPHVVPRKVAWPLRRLSDADGSGIAGWMSRLSDGAGGFLAFARNGESYDFEVAEVNGGCEVLDGAGVLLAGLGPRLLSTDADGAVELLRRLRHLAQYWNLRALKNADGLAPFRDALQLDLDHPGETAKVPAGTRVRLTVINRASVPLNVAILDLQPDWGVRQVFPANGSFAVLEPNVPLALEFEAYLPDGLGRGIDVLKVLGAVEPFDLSALQMPSAAKQAIPARIVEQEAVCSADFRSSPSPAPPGEPSAARGVRLRSDDFASAWTTAQVELCVFREQHSS